MFSKKNIWHGFVFFQDKSLSRIARGSHLVAACRAAEGWRHHLGGDVWWIARVIRPSKSKVKMAHSAPVPCNAWNAWKILEEKIREESGSWEAAKNESAEAKVDL